MWEGGSLGPTGGRTLSTSSSSHVVGKLHKVWHTSSKDYKEGGVPRLFSVCVPRELSLFLLPFS